MRIRADAEGLNHYLHRQKSLFCRYGLSERFTTWDSPEFCHFVDTEGILYYREMQEAGVPFPDSPEMLTVGGETDLRSFLEAGYHCYEQMRPYLPEQFSRVLDFGVGSARTARFLYRHLGRLEFYGYDVDSAAIEYLRQNVPFVHAAISSPEPPLPCPDHHFGFVYSFSVFTHFTARAFRAWLREMHRILEPGALLLISLHGTFAWKAVDAEEGSRRRLNIDEGAFQAARADFERTGFMFCPQSVGSGDIDTETYGISFVDAARLPELISGEFTMVDHIAQAIDNWQDVAILRAK